MSRRAGVTWLMLGLLLAPPPAARPQTPPAQAQPQTITGGKVEHNMERRPARRAYVVNSAAAGLERLLYEP